MADAMRIRSELYNAWLIKKISRYDRKGEYNPGVMSGIPIDSDL